jgi:hypothetical protein
VSVWPCAVVCVWNRLQNGLWFYLNAGSVFVFALRCLLSVGPYWLVTGKGILIDCCIQSSFFFPPFLLFFFFRKFTSLYLRMVGVDGYCCTLSHSVTHARTHTRAHAHACTRARTHAHACTHTHTHAHSVGLLWPIDPPVAETSTWHHTTLTKQISMPPAGVEPAIPARERLQTHVCVNSLPLMFFYHTTW